MSTMIPSDLGDAFCALWDAYRLLWTANDVEHWSGHGAWEEEISDLAERLLQSGLVPDDLRSPSGAVQALQLALAIDEAAEDSHPAARHASSTETMPFVDRWLLHAQLNDGAEGTLIWKHTWNTHGDDPQSIFSNLLRIPSDAAPELVMCFPPVDDRLEPEVGEEDTPLRICCAPFADAADSISFRRNDDDRFLADPACPTAEDVLAALQMLDASGAHVGVLPESTLHLTAIELWAEACTSRPRPRRSNLTWILIGTAAIWDDDSATTAPRNQAVVISRRTGQVLLRHNKRRAFARTAHQVGDWRLHELGDEAAEESLADGTSWELLESQRHRLLVAICEDLARGDNAGWAAHRAGPTHILAPVLDKELSKSRWEAFAGYQWADSVGAHVTVSNSLCIPARRGVQLDHEKAATTLVQEPPMIGEAPYPGDVQTRASRHGLDPVVWEA